MEFSSPYRVLKAFSRKVKACSLAENRPGDILLQLKTNSKFSSGDCDMFVSGPLLNTLYFYFRHFLSTYRTRQKQKQTGMLVVSLRGVNFEFMVMPYPDGSFRG